MERCFAVRDLLNSTVSLDQTVRISSRGRDIVIPVAPHNAKPNKAKSRYDLFSHTLSWCYVLVGMIVSAKSDRSAGLWQEHMCLRFGPWAASKASCEPEMFECRGSNFLILARVCAVRFASELPRLLDWELTPPKYAIAGDGWRHDRGDGAGRRPPRAGERSSTDPLFISFSRILLFERSHCQIRPQLLLNLGKDVRSPHRLCLQRDRGRRLV